MLGEYYEFVGLMVALYLRGLLDTGDYFVVGVDVMQYDPNDPQKYLEGECGFLFENYYLAHFPLKMRFIPL